MGGICRPLATDQLAHSVSITLVLSQYNTG